MNTDNLNIWEIKILYQNFLRYYKARKHIYKFRKNKSRFPNFPEDISENLAKFYIIKYENIPCKRNISSGGDLTKNGNILVEVKAFASRGPTSFGPTERWDCIYFLDLTNFLNDNIKIYFLNEKNSSERFLNIMVNKKDRFQDQIKSGRRPRINFNNLNKQLSIPLVYNGLISDLLKI